MYTTKEEENNTMTKRQQEKLNALLTEIAKEELFVETLEKRWSDNLDFYDVSVWGIKRALERAYEAGQKSVK
ncbi:MAG: hypothetical protein Q615_SPAC00131G0030 [Streptococcus anginosus DORA_7]|jgi:hypothetical protein|uniref:DUF6900 domain-containing protein n=6 Tax=Streptococcus TaxID=1301 RepID=Q6SZ23_STRPY|nr:hypothetical protein [Streptococcus pyogenes]AAT72371.1 hypothetical protein [Streptococcus phage phi1207.3]ANM47673.1 hypothetical protein [Streptococcus phage phiJH1301-2]ETI84153.1 MAG: hypothetical protein Q615_SPAC00131G0030 [Streptococcus anginosus DORA_7]KXA49370.1 hypothetical protein HMPREF1880_01525 [Streptococcus agalactiae]QJD49551.1 hypothetical protein phi29961_0031 [Streptococcus phage phi29961]WAX25490.1 hypothetical protein YS162_GM000037 [Streptococcus phage YS162]